MASRGKQFKLEYLLARSTLGVFGILPRPMAIGLGRAMGRIAYWLPLKLRRTGECNLKIAFPEIGEQERQRLLRGCFDNLGRLLAEFSQFPRMSPERALEYPISFLVRPLDNERIEEMIERIRTRFGNQAIDKKSAARQALRVLRQGGTLGILSDLNTHPFEGVFVPFFGKLACTTAGIATLALKTDAVVIPTCAVWDKKRKRYFFHGDPAVELVRTGNHDKDIEVNTARFAAAIERMVRLYPDQWLWIHKRWKTRPPGEPDLYQ